MKTIELASAHAPLSKYARRVGRTPFVLMESGKPVAALVSLQNVDWETVSLSANRQFIRLIERSRKRQKANGGISSREMRLRLGK